jgi:lipoprotein-anchoring transpeptidase ErfK/SrfK
MNPLRYALIPVTVLAAALLGGCASFTGPDGSTDTLMLGPDGRIVTMSGAPFRPAETAKERKRRERRERESGTSSIPAPVDYWWRDEGAGGPASITIDLTAQRAYFKRGDTVVGETPVSSGREGYRTPAGTFKVTQKSRDHVSNLYGDYVDAHGNVVMENVGVHRDRRPSGSRFRGASMPYFLRFNGAVGMHAGYLPGYPASHGCIRLPMEMAMHFYQHSHHGTPVIVRY